MPDVRFGPELIERLLGYLVSEITGCLGAGLHTERRLVRAVGGTERLDQAQWELGVGPVIDAAGDEDVVRTADLAGDRRWPELAGLTGADGVGVVAVPGSWDENGPVLLTVYLDHEPKEDDLRVIERVEPVLATAAAVVEFCADEVVRADQMVTMVQHRRVIEQAKGLVMAASGVHSGTAFQTLVRASQHFNVKLNELATALVEQVGGAPVTEQEPEAGPGTAAPGRRAREAAERTWLALRR
ncbi:hypothetical protein GCM10010174_16910 [Kutzneria viridogrisea]|uniref:ANTAR domain-containing protein n=1 Tax=Kutzneria viridogrisea TaxID=47990 RepID=A0ABR6BDF8_9PSEU|nr:hypothetical protein [Kutzneria viridogrisea]